MTFSWKWIAHPFAKTSLSQAGGAIGLLLVEAFDNAIQHPTGGFEEFLATHHLWYVGYSIGVGIVHNAISNAFPPGGLPPEPKGSTVEPLRANTV